MPDIIELIPPKTDWKPTDVRNYEDHIRIGNNFNMLRTNLRDILEFDWTKQEANYITTYEDLPTSKAINALERNLYTVWEAMGGSPHALVVWPERGRPSYLDWIRWEEWQIEVQTAIKGTADYVPYCGVFRCGQPRVYQTRWRVFTPRTLGFRAPTLHDGAEAGQDMTRQVDFRETDEE